MKEIIGIIGAMNVEVSTLCAQLENKKTEIISIRCTKTEKDLVERQANKAGKSCSQCVIDAVVAGVERRTEKDKKRI